MPQRSTQITGHRSRFDGFAERSSRFVSEAAFFVISVLVVVIWFPTIVVFRSVDTWQLVINTATSVLAFLLVALLQNSERRNDIALQRKVDALALALVALARHELDGDRAGLESSVDELQAAVGLEERI